MLTLEVEALHAFVTCRAPAVVGASDTTYLQLWATSCRPVDERGEEAGGASPAARRAGAPQEPQWGSAEARERSDRSKGPASVARPGEETAKTERSEV